MRFIGEFRHTVDAKGRLIVPSRMREQLGAGAVVLAKYFNHCIAMFSEDGWGAFETSLLELGRSKEEARDLIRTFAASAHTDEVDKQGRITVPQHLREWAGVERDVVVTGALDHAEIWSPGRWREQVVDNLEERARDLSF